MCSVRSQHVFQCCAALCKINTPWRGGATATVDAGDDIIKSHGMLPVRGDRLCELIWIVFPQCDAVGPPRKAEGMKAKPRPERLLRRTGNLTGLVSPSAHRARVDG
jgi:hypothetical protein